MTDQTDAAFFAHHLHQQKQHFDDVIANYWQRVLPETRRSYSDASAQTLHALMDIMSRGGKRIRASLAEQAYRMFGGQDQEVVDHMGLSVEMIHAYLLIVDDVSDQSDMRRSGPAAHRILEAWHHQTGLSGNAKHFGASMAQLAAMVGMHAAMNEIASLPIAAERRTAALQNLNQLLVTTCHGQINDIYNQAAAVHDAAAAEQVLLWKTAYYSFINPLQLGAILAGASPDALEALQRYGIAAGRAFQISDDIIGLFGTIDVTGKNTMDDVREGKRTMLVLKALERADPDDGVFLESQLGNQNLTERDFKRCQTIVQECGALDYAAHELAVSCNEARHVLQDSNTLLPGDGVRFLRGLADYLTDRKS